MLDVSLEAVTFAYGAESFAIRDLSVTFPRGTHTAVVGPPASGCSTLLALIAGGIRPQRGSIRIGSRDVTSLSGARRPLLALRQERAFPARWSVRHALVAAVRQRTLDREDRLHELDLAAERWGLGKLLDRDFRTLSQSEQTMVDLARVELLKPAILVADRPLSGLAASALADVADDFYRMLRVTGTTVIVASHSRLELGLTDRLLVLDKGVAAQSGMSRQLFDQPAGAATAMATGEVNVIPVTVTAGIVESPLGSWRMAGTPFEGNGLALIRPGDLVVATSGQESDLVFGIEEASFHDGAWIARGFLTGSIALRVRLPAETRVQKGRLLPLRYDPVRIRVIPAA
jgi:ABC-type sugar transport system ATPase subunit